MTLLMNVIESIPDGTFGVKARQKLLRFPPHLIKDGNVLLLQNQATFKDRLRKRFSDQINAGVTDCVREVSDDVIWILWLQGAESAPPLVRACIASCERMTSKKVEVVSEDNLLDFVDLPGYLMDKRTKGIISAAHFSDIVRAELLCRHGGLWADSTVLFTAPIPDFIWDSPLFVFKALDLIRQGDLPTVCSSWFIRSKGPQRIMSLTRNLLLEYWREARMLEDYYLFHLFFALATERYPEDWLAVPTFNNHSPHVMGFELDRTYSEERWSQLVSMSFAHKLTRHVDYADNPTSLYSYIVEH